MSTRFAYTAKYQQFLELPVKHGYFRDSEARYIKLSPTKETLHLLKNLGLVLHITPFNTIKLAFDSHSKEKKTVFQDLVSYKKITFRLDSQDPYFFNYTQLPEYNIGEVLHFNFLIKEISTISGDNDQIFTSHVKKVKTSQPVFNISIEDDMTLVEIKDITGGVVVSASVNKVSYYTVNLSQYPQGIYTLWKNGQKINTFYTNKLIDTPKAFIDIYFGNLQFEDETIHKAPLQINFLARKTIWQYVIVSKRNDIKDLNITCNKKQFNYIGDIKLQDNQVGKIYSPPQIMVDFIEGYLKLPIEEVPKKENIPLLTYDDMDTILLPVADKNRLYTTPIKAINTPQIDRRFIYQFYSRIYYYL